MWIVRLALARPYTFIVMALVIVLLTPVVLLRTPTDIFPDINIPVISLVWKYTGAGTARDGAAHHLQLRARGNHAGQRRRTHRVAIAERHRRSSRYSSSRPPTFRPRSRKRRPSYKPSCFTLPPGTTPPLVAIYSASTVPVIQIGLTSDTPERTGAIRLREQFHPHAAGDGARRGASLPVRRQSSGSISVDIDSQALQSKGLSPV